MKAVTLSKQAKLDLQEIRIFWSRTSVSQRSQASKELRKTIQSIGTYPHIGAGQSELSRIFGEEVRSRLLRQLPHLLLRLPLYPRIFAILHTSRDLRETLTNRSQ